MQSLFIISCLALASGAPDSRRTCNPETTPRRDFHVDARYSDDVVLRSHRNATGNVPQIRCVKQGRPATRNCPRMVVCARYRRPDVAWDCAWSTNWVATLFNTFGTARLRYDVVRDTS